MSATTACLCGAVTLAPMQSASTQRATALRRPRAARPRLRSGHRCPALRTPRCAARARANAPRVAKQTGPPVAHRALLSALRGRPRSSGYEIATLSAPAISAPSPSVPASANSMAMRWSPWLSARPARRRDRRMRQPSACASMSPPSADRPSATTARRSDSLARSSAASRDDRFAVGKQPQQGHQRDLVDRQRHQVAADGGAVQAGWTGPPGQPPARRRRRVRFRARRWRPCARGWSAARFGSGSGRRRARESRRPGAARPARARTRPTRSRPAPATSTQLQRAARCQADRRAVAGRTSAPIARSSRSVWSRVGAGSTTVVSPSANRPASSSADLTWALATLQAVLDAVQGRQPARSTSGANRPPSRPSIAAPARRSGSTMRAIGRRRSDASPLSTAKTPDAGQDAAEQAHARARIAAIQHVGRLAQSAQADAADRGRGPPSRSISTPRLAQAAKRRVAVRARREVGDARLALAQGVEQRPRGARWTCRPARAGCREWRARGPTPRSVGAERRPGSRLAA